MSSLVHLAQTAASASASTASTASERKNQAQIFWRDQLRSRGRTGWLDPVVSAYDQLERLERLKREICKRPIEDRKALDFGCGPGDFSKLLLSLGFAVCGYDPFIKPRLSDARFQYAHSCDDIVFRGHQAKLALSITTLDHILDEDDLRSALAAIRYCLSTGAEFYMIEYALDSEDDRARFGMKNHYQSFRTLSYWRMMLRQSSFEVLEVAPVPHPFISPSSGYASYLCSRLVRFVKRGQRLRFVRLWRDCLLRWQASRVLRNSYTGTEFSEASPLKFIRCVAV